MRLRRLTLWAREIGRQREFFEGALGLPVRASADDAIEVRAGRTVIEFHRAPGAGPAPTYHLAFNIPENKIEPAREWLSARCPALRAGSGGGEITFFDRWNAHAVYFNDPAGNILELIARHTLHNGASGPFGPHEIECASEIGLVTSDVRLMAGAIGRVLGAAPYLGRSADDFTAVWDEHGMLVIVREGRPWFPTDDHRARAWPAEIIVDGVVSTSIDLGGSPYVIRGEERKNSGK